MDTLLIALAVVGVLVVAAAVFLVSRLRTPKAGEILVVTGGKNGPEVHNQRVYVWPFVRRFQTLPIGAQKTEIMLPSVMTSQGVALAVDAVVAFKIDTDPQLVGNAIERFSEDPNGMEDFVHQVFAGHLRAIVGSMTAEDTTIGRDALARAVREASVNEMANFGLKIDSVQIRDVEDAPGSNFLKAWRTKEQARMDSDARQAAAAADQTAREREMEAAARIAEAESKAQIRQSEVVAEADKAKAISDQAGPLAHAQAEQGVIETKTRNAELEAALTERTLQVQIVRPAEAQRDAQVAEAEGNARAQVLAAEAEKTTTQLRAEAAQVQVQLAAQANAESVRVNGVANAESISAIGKAEGDSVRAKGLAEAEAIAARGAAFEQNADAVIQQMIAEQLPAIVAAASAPIGNIQSLSVMDVTTLQQMTGGNLTAALGVLPQIAESLGSFFRAGTPDQPDAPTEPLAKGGVITRREARARPVSDTPQA